MEHYNFSTFSYVREIKFLSSELLSRVGRRQIFRCRPERKRGISTVKNRDSSPSLCSGAPVPAHRCRRNDNSRFSIPSVPTSWQRTQLLLPMRDLQGPPGVRSAASLVGYSKPSFLVTPRRSGPCPFWPTHRPAASIAGFVRPHPPR